MTHFVAFRPLTLEQNTPVLSLRRHLGCCGKTLVVSFIPTRDNPNPTALMHEVLESKVRRHTCEGSE